MLELYVKKLVEPASSELAHAMRPSLGGRLALLTILLSGCGNVVGSDPYPAGVTASGAATLTPYMLPKAEMRVRLRRQGERVTLDVAQPIAVGDAQHRYLLRHRASFFASDELEVEVDKRGLLTTGKLTADGQVDDIAVDAGKSLGAVASIAESASPNTGEEIVYDDNLNPTDSVAVERVANELNRRYGLIRKRDCAASGPNTCITFQISSDGFVESPSSDIGESNVDCNKNICYRGVLPYYIHAGVVNEDKSVGDFSNTSRQRVILPDMSNVLYLDTTRPAFVTRTTNFTLVDGFVQKIYVKQPSGGRELVSLPLRFIEAVLSGIVSGLTSRTAAVDAQTKLIEANTKRDEAQIKARNEAASADEGKIQLVLQVNNGLAPPAPKVLPTQVGGGGVAGGTGGAGASAQGAGAGSPVLPVGGGVLENPR